MNNIHNNYTNNIAVFNLQHDILNTYKHKNSIIIIITLSYMYA